MILNESWEKYPEIIQILNNIYLNSQEELRKIGYPTTFAQEFITYIEDMLIYYKEYNYDLIKFINTLKEIDAISFIHLFLLHPNQKISKDFKTLPPVINKDNKILINPFLDGDVNLSVKERRRLYLYHGILQRVIKLQNEKTKEFSKMYIEADEEIETLVNNGWLLLEEVIAQAEAENITYRILGKPLPKPTIGTDKYDILADYKYGIYSELELYRMYEPILIKFGMAISDVGTKFNHDNNDIKRKIILKALKGNLSKEVICEYITKEKPFELYKMLYGMGLLINEKYAIYGNRNYPHTILTDIEINKIFNNIIFILERNATLDEKRYLTDISIKRRYIETTEKPNDPKQEQKMRSKIRSLRYIILD